MTKGRDAESELLIERFTQMDPDAQEAFVKLAELIADHPPDQPRLSQEQMDFFLKKHGWKIFAFVSAEL